MSDLRKKILNGERVIGTMINFVDHIDIVKILKVCGFDFFMIDLEHGYMDYTKMAAMAALAKEMDIAILARVPGPQREAVLRMMDMGMDGIMMPNAESKEQAETLIQNAKYAPLGNRGVSLLRGHSCYNPQGTAAEVMANANGNTLIIVQIESVKGLENMEEILSVDGVDVAFIGPNDLCLSLGIPGQMNSPVFIEAVDKVMAYCREKGKASGIQLMDAAALVPWMEKGMAFNMYANEVVMMMNSAKEALRKLKG